MTSATHSGAHLADDDATSPHCLATIDLNTPALGLRVAAVPGGTGTLLVGILNNKSPPGRGKGNAALGQGLAGESGGQHFQGLSNNSTNK